MWNFYDKLKSFYLSESHNKTNKIIVYIHGANATSQSFGYIKSQLSEYDALTINYTSDVPLRDNIKNIYRMIKEQCNDKEIYIVSHSLGGIIAVALSHVGLPVKKIVTIGTPFGGSKTADMLLWLHPNYQLFKDTSTKSNILKSLRKHKLTTDTLSIVSNKGINAVFNEPNDGTVTVSSQMALEGPKYIEVNLNHFEVLISDEVVFYIRKFFEEQLFHGNDMIKVEDIKKKKNESIHIVV